MKRLRNILPLLLALGAWGLAPAGPVSPCRAGTPYSLAVGQPPVVTSLAWKPWYQRLLAYRLNECPVARTTTYYFSQGGNDTTGAGTLTSPYQTIAKANAIIQGSSGNVACLFKRGDVWKETATYSVPLASAPATGQPTVLVNFAATATYPTAGESVTLTGGTPETLTVASYAPGSGSITFTANVANAGHTGISYASGPLSGGAVMYNSKLVVQYGDRVDPGPYQAASGWGGAQAAQPWSDLANCRAFEVSCDCRARTPGAVDAQPQTCALTSASQGAASVTITAPPAASAGPQPNTMATLVGGSSAPESVYVSAYNSSTGVVTFASNVAGSARNAVQFAVPPATSGYASQIAPYWWPYTAVACGKYEFASALGSVGGDSWMLDANHTPGATTWFLNDTLSADFAATSSINNIRVRSLFDLASGQSAPQFWNCRLHVRVGTRDVSGIEDNATNAVFASGIVVKNCIVSCEYAETGSGVGVGNLAANQSNNAYSAMTTKTGTAGYSNDPYYVEVSAPPLYARPEPGSALLTAHNQLVGGVYRLEYDATWQPRSLTTPAIGPLEPLAPPVITPRRTNN